MSLKNRFQRWWYELIGEYRPSPPAILSETEAVERIRAYASAHNQRFADPRFLGLRRKYVNSDDLKFGARGAYFYALATTRPATFVEVDAEDGTILTWRRGPR